jgi:hypothetical protein
MIDDIFILIVIVYIYFQEAIICLEQTELTVVLHVFYLIRDETHAFI